MPKKQFQLADKTQLYSLSSQGRAAEPVTLTELTPAKGTSNSDVLQAVAAQGYNFVLLPDIHDQTSIRRGQNDMIERQSKQGKPITHLFGEHKKADQKVYTQFLAGDRQPLRRYIGINDHAPKDLDQFIRFSTEQVRTYELTEKYKIKVAFVDERPKEWSAFDKVKQELRIAGADFALLKGLADPKDKDPDKDKLGDISAMTPKDLQDAYDRAKAYEKRGSRELPDTFPIPGNIGKADAETVAKTKKALQPYVEKTLKTFGTNGKANLGEIREAYFRRLDTLLDAEPKRYLDMLGARDKLMNANIAAVLPADGKHFGVMVVGADHAMPPSPKRKAIKMPTLREWLETNKKLKVARVDVLAVEADQKDLAGKLFMGGREGADFTLFVVGENASDLTIEHTKTIPRAKGPHKDKPKTLEIPEKVGMLTPEHDAASVAWEQIGALSPTVIAASPPSRSRDTSL